MSNRLYFSSCPTRIHSQCTYMSKTRREIREYSTCLGRRMDLLPESLRCSGRSGTTCKYARSEITSSTSAVAASTGRSSFSRVSKGTNIRRSQKLLVVEYYVLVSLSLDVIFITDYYFFVSHHIQLVHLLDEKLES